MRSGFVRASELYDVENRTPIAHPAHQATDADVRQALEDQKIRADGGQSSRDSIQSSSASKRLSERSITGTNSVPSQVVHPSRLPIGRRSPFGISSAAYTDPQPSQAATSRFSSSPVIFVGLADTTEKDLVRLAGVTQLIVTAVTTDKRSINPETNYSDPDSENSTRNRGDNR